MSAPAASSAGSMSSSIRKAGCSVNRYPTGAERDLNEWRDFQTDLHNSLFLGLCLVLLMALLCGCRAGASLGTKPIVRTQDIPLPDGTVQAVTITMAAPIVTNSPPPIIPLTGIIMPFRLQPTGCTFIQETSTDMIHWVECYRTNGGGSGLGYITNLFDGQKRFYRGHWVWP